MADRAIIRISALPDSQLRRALTGTVDAARKASRQVATEEQRTARASEHAKEKAATAAAHAAAKLASEEIREGKRSARAKEAEVKRSQAAQVREVQRAERAKEAETKRSEALQARETQKAESEKRREIEKTLRTAERAARSQLRETQKSVRAQIREAEKAGRARQRTERRDADDAAGGRRRLLFAAGGAVLGAGAAALGRVRSLQSTFGARSTEDMAAQAVEFQRRSIVVSDMAGMKPDERKGVEQKVLTTSARTGIAADQLLAGLERAQDKFSDLRGFTKILDDLANISVATGASVESVVGAMGVMRRQFHLTDAEMKELGGAMVQAADLGNIGFDELADNFASALGALGRNANMQGMGGAIKALAISQTLGASDKGAAESAVLATNLVTSLNRVTVQQEMKKRFGVSLTEGGIKGGKLRDLDVLVQELADKGFMSDKKGGARQVVFPDVQAKEAIEVLVKQFQTDPETVKKLLTLDPAVGGNTIKRRVTQMNEGTLGQAATLAARQFETFMKGDSMQKYVDIAVKSADSLTQLEAKYPLMKEAVETTTGALKGFAAALLAERLGRAAGGLGGMGGDAAAGAGAAWAGAGALSKVGIVGAALSTGVAAYGMTRAALELTGGDELLSKVGAGYYDWTHFAPDPAKRRGFGPAPAAPAPPLLYSEARPEDWQSPAPPIASVQPPPPPAEATLKIKIEGPGKVMSVSSDGFGDIDVMSVDTGSRRMTP